jgi:hypothetical protein
MSVSSIPDDELLRRAVRDCRDSLKPKGVKHYRWEAVMDTFIVGRTYACELCERFGFDPDEMVKR